MHIIVPLANGCEELEAVTIIDLLRRADQKVISVGLTGQDVLASRGVRLVADKSLVEVQDLDVKMIVLPGGLKGRDQLIEHKAFMAYLTKLSKTECYIAAICAAPSILESIGLLKGRKATSYPGFLTDPETVVSERSVVQDGRIITSRGPGTAMEFGLYLIEILTDKVTRLRVEQELLYS